MKKREKTLIELLEELNEAIAEFKKILLETYIKSPMGRSTIWLLDWLSEKTNKEE